MEFNALFKCDRSFKRLQKNSFQLSPTFSLTVIALISIPGTNLIAQSPPSNTPWLFKTILKWLQPQRRRGGSTSERYNYDPHHGIFRSQSGSGSIELDRSIEEPGDIQTLCLSPSFSSEYHYLWTRQPLITCSRNPSALQIIDVQRKNQFLKIKPKKKLHYRKLLILSNTNYGAMCN
jgi:hypothetical protein